MEIGLGGPEIEYCPNYVSATRPDTPCTSGPLECTPSTCNGQWQYGPRDCAYYVWKTKTTCWPCLSSASSPNANIAQADDNKINNSNNSVVSASLNKNSENKLTSTNIEAPQKVRIAQILKPLPPTNLESDVISETQVNLTWQDNALFETDYMVDILEGTTWRILTYLPKDTESFQFIFGQPGRIYQFRVYCSWNGNVMSDYSNLVTVKMNGLYEPSDLFATVLAGPKIKLNWYSNEVDDIGQKIERATNINGPWTVIGSVSEIVTAFTDPDVVVGTTYYYRIYCYNDEYTSGYSNIVSATAQLSPPPPPPPPPPPTTCCCNTSYSCQRRTVDCHKGYAFTAEPITSFNPDGYYWDCGNWDECSLHMGDNKTLIKRECLLKEKGTSQLVNNCKCTHNENVFCNNFCKDKPTKPLTELDCYDVNLVFNSNFEEKGSLLQKFKYWDNSLNTSIKMNLYDEAKKYGVGSTSVSIKPGIFSQSVKYNYDTHPLIPGKDQIIVQPNATYVLSGMIKNLLTSGNAYFDLNDGIDNTCGILQIKTILCGFTECEARSSMETRDWEKVECKFKTGQLTNFVTPRLVVDGVIPLNNKGFAYFDNIEIKRVNEGKVSYDPSKAGVASWSNNFNNSGGWKQIICKAGIDKCTTGSLIKLDGKFISDSVYNDTLNLPANTHYYDSNTLPANTYYIDFDFNLGDPNFCSGGYFQFFVNDTIAATPVMGGINCNSYWKKWTRITNMKLNTNGKDIKKLTIKSTPNGSGSWVNIDNVVIK